MRSIPASIQRHRPDAVRDARGAGLHGGRSVPREGRADADRRPRDRRAWSARRSRRCCSGTATPSASASSSADNFGLFVTLVLVAVGILTIMFSSQVVDRDGIPAGEYYALVLFAIVGMMMMATANDLLVIFIALEILSLAVYVLTGIRRDRSARRPRRRSSTSCSAPSRARSSSTGSRSPTASPAARA